jgi:hypothetical protein
MSGTFDLDANVIRFLLTARFAPAIGEQVLKKAVRVLAELVGARNLDVQAQMPDLFVVSHRPNSVAAGPIFALAQAGYDFCVWSPQLPTLFC